MKMQHARVYILLDVLCFAVLALDLEQGGHNSEKSQKLLKRGFKNFPERCLANGGEEVLNEYLVEQENLIYCMMTQFDLEEMQGEIETKRKTSDLDLVFKKYCSDHVPAARECLASFLAASAPCLAEEERPGLNVTLDMVDSGLQFACHGDGDRIALFLSEGGVECVTANKKELLTCVKKSVPEAFSPVQRRRNANSMHFYVFQKENCRKGDAIIRCVEETLLSRCEDPTPSNLLHGLLTAMRTATPCSAVSSAPAPARFVPSLLIAALLLAWSPPPVAGL